jgi:hypothetical protein
VFQEINILMDTSDEDDEVNSQTRKSKEVLNSMKIKKNIAIECKNRVQENKLIRSNKGSTGE